MATSFLEIYLEPFSEHLLRPDVTDIFVNRPGELWVETLGCGPVRHEAPGLDDALLLRLARQVASLTHQGISREHPLLAATLPDGSRVQVVAPPATRGGPALAIRRHVSADLSIGDYENAGAFSATRGADDARVEDERLARLHAAGDWGEFLRLAVRARRTVMVSGGTSTGKTTFVNALMAEIPTDERLLLIEDTPELRLRHANAVGMVVARGRLGEASVTAEDLLIASLRMRPDRIILGELRGVEASTFLRAVNTGHPGSLTTIHADTPSRAFEQLAFLVMQGGTRMGRRDILDYVRSVVDVVVQLGRSAGRRRVEQIVWVPAAH